MNNNNFKIFKIMKNTFTSKGFFKIHFSFFFSMSETLENKNDKPLMTDSLDRTLT